MSKASGLTPDGKWATVIGIITIILTLVGILVAVAQCSGKGKPGKASDNPSIEPSPLITASPTQTATGDPPTEEPVQPTKMPQPHSSYLGTESFTTAGGSYTSAASSGLLGCHGTLDSLDFPLDGRWGWFKATVGLAQDKTRPNTRAKFIVFLGPPDSTSVGYQKTIGRDDSANISVRITGVKTLRLQAQPTAGDVDSCVRIGVAVWGNARVIR